MNCVTSEYVCYWDRFGDNDVEMAAAGCDDCNDTEHAAASYMPMPPAVATRPAAAAAM